MNQGLIGLDTIFQTGAGWMTDFEPMMRLFALYATNLFGEGLAETSRLALDLYAEQGRATLQGDRNAP